MKSKNIKVFLKTLIYHTFSNHWLATILINPEKTGNTNEDLQIQIRKRVCCIQTFMEAGASVTYFSYFSNNLNTTYEKLFAERFYLPSGTGMSDEDHEKVIGVIIKYPGK